MVASTPTFVELLNDLNDQNYKARRNAATSLRKHYPSQALQPICNLLTDRHAHVRSHAAKELGKLKDKGAVGPLSYLLHDSRVRTRVQAVRALGQLKEASAVSPLLAALNDERQEVRIEAINMLGKSRDKRTVPHLLAKLQPANEELGVYILYALGQIRDERSIEPLARLLSDVLSGTSGWSRGTAYPAIGALGKIGGNRALAQLLELYESIEQSDIRHTIFGVLQTIKQVQGEEKERARVLLLQVLQEKQHSIYLRRVAARALGDSFRGAQVVQPLLACLDDPDRWLVQEVIEALGNNRDRQAVEPLLHMLETEPYAVIPALARLKDPRSVEPLTRLLDCNGLVYDNKQIPLINTLEKIGDVRAIEPLKAVLNHPSRFYHYTAQKALTALEKKRAAHSSP